VVASHESIAIRHVLHKRHFAFNHVLLFVDYLQFGQIDHTQIAFAAADREHRGSRAQLDILHAGDFILALHAELFQSNC